MNGEVFTEDDGAGVRKIVLNRPDELNAWTYNLEAELFEALDSARDDTAVRVVTITGAGRGFCAGASLSILTPEAMAARPSVEVRRRITELVHFPKPVVAVINGAAAGIGLALALACDIRIAAEDAKLTTAFARRGLVAEHGMAWLLPRLVGRGRATELLMSGRVLTGVEAERIGLITAAVPTDDLTAYARDWTTELIAHCAPTSWAVMKRQLVEAETQDVDAAYLAAIPLMEESHRGPDLAEGVRAFHEKRAPRFTSLPVDLASLPVDFAALPTQ